LDYDFFFTASEYISMYQMSYKMLLK